MIRPAFFAALLALGACAPRFRAAEAPPAPLSLTEDSSGQRFDIAVGQEALLRLDSNPSTGYRWGVAGTPGAVVAIVGEPQYQAPAVPRPGAGGTETWRLRAMTRGQATLTWEYRRAWDKVLPAARTVSITFLAR